MVSVKRRIGRWDNTCPEGSGVIVEHFAKTRSELLLNKSQTRIVTLGTRHSVPIVGFNYHVPPGEYFGVIKKVHIIYVIFV